jgi:hypothetical protein
MRAWQKSSLPSWVIGASGAITSGCHGMSDRRGCAQSARVRIGTGLARNPAGPGVGSEPSKWMTFLSNAPKPLRAMQLDRTRKMGAALMERAI